MSNAKTILITGSTDGIGLLTAKTLAKRGHTVLLHGRSESKLAKAKSALLEVTDPSRVEAYAADLSVLGDVEKLSSAINARQTTLDVLINNAGVFVVPETVADDGLDVRFLVNTIAPYWLSKQLLAVLGASGRIVNLSSAAQASIDPVELTQSSPLDDGVVYAKSKLAITMWSKHLAGQLGDQGPAIIAVNPASFLGSKMVKEAYGRQGGDLQKGADILVKAALADEFAEASGLYFDNDVGQFTSPHPDALDTAKNQQIADTIDRVLADQHAKSS